MEGELLAGHFNKPPGEDNPGVRLQAASVGAHWQNSGMLRSLSTARLGLAASGWASCVLPCLIPYLLKHPVSVYRLFQAGLWAACRPRGGPVCESILARATAVSW